MALEVNIFILVLIIIVLILLYWIHLDNSGKTEQIKAILEKPTEEKREHSKPYIGDYGKHLAVFGFFMGAWVVYLWGIPLFDKAPIQDLINFVTNNRRLYICGSEVDIIGGSRFTHDKYCLEPVPDSVYTTLIYMVTGAILGVVVGWLAGKHLKK